MQRKRVYELDYMRSMAIFSVVALHVLGFFYYTGDLPNSNWQMIDGYIMYILRYARQIFMFLTGFVLVYNYFEKPFIYRIFLWKRSRTIIVPYIFWAFFYVGISMYFSSNSDYRLDTYLKQSIHSILAGDAYYHLYYVVVTAQFYILFPLILRWLRKIKHSRLWLMASGISYLAVMGWMYWGWNEGELDPSNWKWIPYSLQPLTAYLVNHCDRVWFSYYGYYVLGGFAALYLPIWKNIINRYSKWFYTGTMLFAVLFFIDYQVRVIHGNLSYGTVISVFKPSMFLYTISMLGVMYKWAIQSDKKPMIRKILQRIAKESFGIYLVHPFILFLFESYGIPVLTNAKTPHMIQILLTLGIGICGSYLVVRFFCRIPVLSWSLGKSTSKEEFVQSMNQLKNWMNNHFHSHLGIPKVRS